MTYQRTAGQKQADFLNARAVEELVASHLGPWTITSFDAADRLDVFIPGAYVEVKEKRQPIGARWPLPCREEDAFILDELSLRRGLRHFPECFFVLRDTPQNRWFVARIDELACADRIRLNRDTGTVKKGKHVLDVSQFRQLDSLEDLQPLIFADLIATDWKSSSCVVEKGLVEL